jgi:hypothetical protein
MFLDVHDGSSQEDESKEMLFIPFDSSSFIYLFPLT